jgi:hypothetical protein
MGPAVTGDRSDRFIVTGMGIPWWRRWQAGINSPMVGNTGIDRMGLFIQLYHLSIDAWPGYFIIVSDSDMHRLVCYQQVGCCKRYSDMAMDGKTVGPCCPYKYCALLFFDKGIIKKIYRRFKAACLFALATAIAGYLLRPYYAISKIYATPTWCLYSVAICTILYSILYWLTDILKYDKWTVFFQPAASNPLLVYILPGIIMYLQIWLGLYFMPVEFHEGIPGIAWSVCYAVIIMILTMGLNKLKIKLQL